MKTNFFFIFSIIILFFTACKSEDISEDFTLAKDSYDVTYNTESQEIPITSNTNWTVTSDQSWCTPTVNNGTGDKTLIISLIGNITTSARTATLTFTIGNSTKLVTITQEAGTGEDYPYKLPVIFHVLYKDANDSLQYVKKGWMNTILTAVNKLYSDNGMNLSFYLATYDPEGNILDEAGIDREQVTNPTIDCDDFMDGKDANNTAYVNMLWDLDKYINIFLYQFKSDNSDYITMGVTHLPYVSSSYPLDGLNNGEYYLTHSWAYPHCSSINNDYIYSYDPTSVYYNPEDITVTIAHELGHYLGLFHPFTETGETTCSGTDYCEDTPNYDRTTYETWVINYIQTQEAQGANLTLKNLAARTSCDDGSTFTGNNIMDYAYCYSNKFTSDQCERARYILKYGLFIPGPKYDTVSKSSRSVINAVRPPILYKR